MMCSLLPVLNISKLILRYLASVFTLNILSDNILIIIHNPIHEYGLIYIGHFCTNANFICNNEINKLGFGAIQVQFKYFLSMFIFTMSRSSEITMIIL